MTGKGLLPRYVLEADAVVVLHLQNLIRDALVHVTENLSQRTSNEWRLFGRFQRHCVAGVRCHWRSRRLRRQFRSLRGPGCEQEDLANFSVRDFHPRPRPWHWASEKGTWQGHWGGEGSSSTEGRGRWWWWWWGQRRWCNRGANGDCRTCGR